MLDLLAGAWRTLPALIDFQAQFLYNCYYNSAPGFAFMWYDHFEVLLPISMFFLSIVVMHTRNLDWIEFVRENSIAFSLQHAVC